MAKENEEHQKFLQMAIEESHFSIEHGSSPFGAVIVKDGKIISTAHNSVVFSKDATAHAEVNAIRMAGKVLNTYDLTGCILYTSCEPCPMCLNAAKWANIKEVYFAADRNDADRIGFRDRVFYEKNNIKMKHLSLIGADKIMQEWYFSKDKKPY